MHEPADFSICDALPETKTEHTVELGLFHIVNMYLHTLRQCFNLMKTIDIESENHDNI